MIITELAITDIPKELQDFIITKEKNLRELGFKVLKIVKEELYNGYFTYKIYAVSTGTIYIVTEEYLQDKNNSLRQENVISLRDLKVLNELV